MAFHSLETLGSNHAIHFIEYADAATREADTSLSSNDVKKIALQTDDNSYWLLLDTTPTWQGVGAEFVAEDGYAYWGEEDVDDSWRQGPSGADFIIQKREAGVWTTKLTITA